MKTNLSHEEISTLCPELSLLLHAGVGLGDGLMEDVPPAKARCLECRRKPEAALHRACVACCATEGVYPPDEEYLKERYGIQVDEEAYKMDYQVLPGT